MIVCQSIEIDGSHSIRISDDTMLSISNHFTGIQSISIKDCIAISNNGLINISKQYPKLLSLKIHYCRELTDASIISISTHCTGLQSLNLWLCNLITDVSFISISTHCTENMPRQSIPHPAIRAVAYEDINKLYNNAITLSKHFSLHQYDENYINNDENSAFSI